MARSSCNISSSFRDSAGYPGSSEFRLMNIRFVSSFLKTLSRLSSIDISTKSTVLKLTAGCCYSSFQLSKNWATLTSFVWLFCSIRLISQAWRSPILLEDFMCAPRICFPTVSSTVFWKRWEQWQVQARYDALHAMERREWSSPGICPVTVKHLLLWGVGGTCSEHLLPVGRGRSGHAYIPFFTFS